MILKEQPQFDKHCRWQFVEKWNCYQGKEKWIELLSVQPQFAYNCKDWSIFRDFELITMISNQPQLAIHVNDIDKRGGKVCALVLKVIPKIMKQCKFEQFSSADISEFVLEMDSVDDDILTRFKWNNIHGEDLVAILSFKPGYVQFIADKQWRTLTAQNWAKLLVAQSQFKKQFDEFANDDVKREVSFIVVNSN